MEKTLSSVDDRIRDVFREVFDNDQMEISDSLSPKDVPDWDSLAQVRLIITLEEEFSVKFTTQEVAQMTCVGDLKQALAGQNVE